MGGNQVQILYRFSPCSWRGSRWLCVRQYTLPVLYDGTFRQVIQGVAIRPESEAEIAEMEIIVHAASKGRFRRNAPQHIHALRTRIEPKQIARAAVGGVDRVF